MSGDDSFSSGSGVSAGAPGVGTDVVRIADLVALPELRLAVAAGAAHLGRPVEAAHVSELLTPGQWLQGGELLMTIGLLLPMTDEACAAYVRDAAADGSGACGLVLGLGRDLPHQSAPEPLVGAAEAAGMPLLTVPDEVPFIAVTKAVFDARAAVQRRALERAFEAQRRLTTAAASGQGLTATLRAWTVATGVTAVVTDPLGRLIADAGNGVAGGSSGALPDAAGDLLGRVAARGLHGSGSSIRGDLRVEVLPLGAERLRGLLVLGGHIGAEERLLASGLVSLLTLELERRHLADEPVRRRRAALLGRLLAAETTPEQARDVLAGAGLGAERVRGFAVETATGGERAESAPGAAQAGPPPGPAAADVPSRAGADPGSAAELAADLALALPGGLVRIGGGVVEAVCGDDLDVREVLDRFAPGRAAGIGPVTPPEAAASSVRQARALLPLSRASGRPVEAEHGGSSALLLDLADRDTLTAFADTVLGPLDAADPSGELAATLEAWLEAGGSWDETARRLGVHRHTVRNRIDKAMAATGRHLDAGGDRFDLWMAVRIRRRERP
ncbi:PucR family transcriptional regulator [Yinghuangia aomiensis]|uniref:PucR family transcriptional regulator n=2 Tax=Yinghuangia aomiensis TaxID=676205 RepID=A0ABP9H0W9_9ACTN